MVSGVTTVNDCPHCGIYARELFEARAIIERDLEVLGEKEDALDRAWFITAGLSVAVPLAGAIGFWMGATS